jgi:hypothetical protein
MTRAGKKTTSPECTSYSDIKEKSDNNVLKEAKGDLKSCLRRVRRTYHPQKE